MNYRVTGTIIPQGDECLSITLKIDYAIYAENEVQAFFEALDIVERRHGVFIGEAKNNLSVRKIEEE